ncbi:hypothetical protein BGZ60DRAFT_421713 [Tricladium varicosporioides]|nr:hypothetical protein BGZ60DRAFT_421713 [Hymenoscyphus varicosporioides]
MAALASGSLILFLLKRCRLSSAIAMAALASESPILFLLKRCRLSSAIAMAALASGSPILLPTLPSEADLAPFSRPPRV